MDSPLLVETGFGALVGLVVILFLKCRNLEKRIANNQVLAEPSDPRIDRPTFTTPCCDRTYENLRWKPHLRVKCHCGETTWSRSDPVLVGAILEEEV